MLHDSYPCQAEPTKQQIKEVKSKNVTDKNGKSNSLRESGLVRRFLWLEDKKMKNQSFKKVV